MHKSMMFFLRSKRGNPCAKKGEPLRQKGGTPAPDFFSALQRQGFQRSKFSNILNILKGNKMPPFESVALVKMWS